MLFGGAVPAPSTYFYCEAYGDRCFLARDQLMFNRLIRPLIFGALAKSSSACSAGLTQLVLLPIYRPQNRFPKTANHLFIPKGIVMTRKLTRSATNVLIVDDHPVVLSRLPVVVRLGQQRENRWATDAKSGHRAYVRGSPTSR